ncbi:MAG: carboxypeptidase-like regulatory domain-containing protein, partial [Pirellulales bacterium]|nr:carboxypeptidase-like regulatory domain-containing protein [Pirellulales bacterium]
MRSYRQAFLPIGLWVLISNSLVCAQSPYRVQGSVTDADTKQPVANATVQVFIASEANPADRIREARSDKNGRYSIELPIGHARAWMLVPPHGYRLVQSNSNMLDFFATTQDEPVFTKNYLVRQAIPVRLAIRYPDGMDELPTMFASLGQQGDNAYVYGGCKIGDDG